MIILEDRSTLIPPAWCWRDEWISGYDSAFGLLQKFALLNAATAKQVAEAFLNRTSRRRTAILRSVDVDLRESALFDIALMANVFRTRSAVVAAAFLDQRCQTPGESQARLKWCRLCMSWGLHLPCSQLTLARTCPLHGIALQDRCDHCGGHILYRLNEESFARPFMCPGCETDLAPALRRTPSKVPRLRSEEKSRIALMQRHLDEHKRMKSQTVAVPTTFGEILVTQPRVELNDLQSYLGFIGQVSSELSSDGMQLHLALSEIERAECGYSRNVPDDEDRPNLGNGELPGFGIDKQIQVTKRIYTAVKHHVVRRVLGQHAKCSRQACQHLWWDMRGAITAPICPHAAAYLRWRMTWEGCGTPRYLERRRDIEYFGILGWLYSRPAPYPDTWAANEKAWMLSHIFRTACLGSYTAISRRVLADTQEARLQWSTEEGSPTGAKTFWALAEGTDAARRPRLFIPREHLPTVVPMKSSEHEAHTRWHRGQLGLIVR